MKICLLTNTYRPHVGGVARSVDTLAEQCRARGHDVLVVAPGFQGDTHEQDPGILRVPAWQNFNGSDFSVRAPLPRLVRRRIRRFQPDLLHSHHPFLMGDTALRMSSEFNRPLVFTHHTLYENYTHYVPFDSPVLKRIVIELATEYANACSAVIAPSESVARLLRARGVKTPISVIPTGIDSQALANGDRRRFRGRYGMAEEATVLGHVGRLAREKNLPFLAQAAASALRDASHAYCVIVGDGPEVSNMRDIFDRFGVSDRVVFTGKLTGDALNDAYAAMDLFVFSSQTETQGMVLAEAMAAGCPVVALDGPGVRDVVTDRGNGRLLETDATATDMARILTEAIENDGDRSAWAAGARDSAREFDRVRCTQRTIELYRSLQQGRGMQNGDWGWWDRLLGRMEAEWELIASKAESAGRGLQSTRRGSRQQGSTNSNGS